MLAPGLDRLGFRTAQRHFYFPQPLLTSVDRFLHFLGLGAVGGLDSTLNDGLVLGGDCLADRRDLGGVGEDGDCHLGDASS